MRMYDSLRRVKANASLSGACRAARCMASTRRHRWPAHAAQGTRRPGHDPLPGSGGTNAARAGGSRVLQRHVSLGARPRRAVRGHPPDPQAGRPADRAMRRARQHRRLSPGLRGGGERAAVRGPLRRLDPAVELRERRGNAGAVGSARGLARWRTGSLPRPTVPPEPRNFIRTVCLVRHLDALPAELHEPFLDRVLERTGRAARTRIRTAEHRRAADGPVDWLATVAAR